MRLIIAVLLMLSGYAHASCSSISDSDQRTYCYAKTKGESCSTISNSDLRNECNALKR
ncbi:hypothetical protein [Pseudomonas sp. SJZ131]|uniref:hypothetical protein n=1 Tax=Pseudomonas sp. SJZ131 TaxID=2572895 RepID=UPI0015B67366|nr:hypothetical protein [Pseudomonas sp. SJZ131]